MPKDYRGQTEKSPALDESMYLDDDKTYLDENPTEKSTAIQFYEMLESLPADITAQEFKSTLKAYFPNDFRLVGYYFAMFLLAHSSGALDLGFNFAAFENFCDYWILHIKDRKIYQQSFALNEIYLREFYKMIDPKSNFMGIDLSIESEDTKLIIAGSEFAKPTAEL